MASRQLLSRSIQFFLGAAVYNRAFSAKPGVPFDPVVIYRVAPLTVAATGICAAQAVAGAGNATINGTLASGGVATITVPCNLTVVSASAGDTTQTVTATGTDVYGETMTETIALNGTTTVQGKKAFATVTQVAVSAATAGNLSVGIGKIIGLPYRADESCVLSARFNNAIDAGTFVPAVTTAASATTGDIRGTFSVAGTPDATKVLVLSIFITDRSTKTGAYGVAQA
jgi:hypothetical protein